MSTRRFETMPATAGPAPARQPDQTQAWRLGPPTSRDATAEGHRRLDPTGALLLRLQRQYGNRYVQRVVALGRPGGPASGVPLPQPKLALGPARDRYEREADQVARQVAARSAQDGWGRQAGSGREEDTAPRPPDIQRLHGSPADAVDATVERGVSQARGSGQAVPEALRSRAERALGADLSAVRVHTGARVDQLNEALGSHAFTVGGDVFVHRSRPRPGTRAGDELLAHELTHTVQQGAATAPGRGSGPPSPAPATVQRDFGFELELPVLLTSNGDGGMGKREPRSDPKKVVGHSADPQYFEIHVDHSKSVRTLLLEGSQLRESPPILELVTKPMDEFTVGEDQVRTLMGQLVTTAESIKTKAIDADERILLDDVDGVTAAPPQTNYVGSEKDNDPDKRVQSVNAMVQQTYGVSLRRVTQEFGNRLTERGSWFENPAAAPGSVDPDESLKTREALRSSTSFARSMREWMTDNLDTPFSPDEETMVDGLFSLIFYYLLRGKDVAPGGLIKKNFGIFFYKTKLSTVRNNLTADIPGLATLLGDQVKRAKIVTELLIRQRAKRYNDDDAEEVTAGAGISRKAWVEEVLAGQDDTVFERARNAWSSELRADRIGQGSARAPGVVLENRQFAATKGRKEESRYRPSEWPEMAVELWRRLRNLQGAPNS